MTIDDILDRANRLAHALQPAGVKENQLNLALTHLKRQRDVPATLRLVNKLKLTPFARRSNRTKGQLEELARALEGAIRSVQDWRDAAAIVGWARRLLPAMRQEAAELGYAPQQPRREPRPAHPGARGPR